MLLCRLFFALLRPHIPTDAQALAMIRRHLLPLLLVQLMLLPLAACAQSATGPVEGHDYVVIPDGQRWSTAADRTERSEERLVGERGSGRFDLGGRRCIKKKK